MCVLWLTCLSPDGQILILLDIQHDLQSISHPALLGFPRRGLVPIECVAFPISGVDLQGVGGRFLSGGCHNKHDNIHSPPSSYCTRTALKLNWIYGPENKQDNVSDSGGGHIAKAIQYML